MANPLYIADARVSPSDGWPRRAHSLPEGAVLRYSAAGVPFAHGDHLRAIRCCDAFTTYACTQTIEYDIEETEPSVDDRVASRDHASRMGAT